MSETVNKDPVVICQYRVKEESQEAFVALLRRHWPTLRTLGLATEDAPLIYRGADRNGKPVYWEIFSWADAATGPRAAHESPEVMAIWEPMGALCEERDGRPSMEFPHVSPFPVDYAQA